MKHSERWQWEELRHRLVLTPEEKRVITFVIAAFLLGLATKFYRDTRPRLPATIEKQPAVSHRGRHQPFEKRD